MFRRLRTDESGNILITVVLISVVIGSLTALALESGRQADVASASDRNSEIALGVAEAGIHHAIARIDSQAATGDVGGTFCMEVDPPPASTCVDVDPTPEGPYKVTATRTPRGFLIDSQGRSGGIRSERERRIRVELLPPPLFADGGDYALFSSTNIDLKNNDVLEGDVFANDSIIIRSDTAVDGDVTSATSWIRLDQKADVKKGIWSGGYDPTSQTSIRLGPQAIIRGPAKASVTAPTDPETCDGENPELYTISLSNGAAIEGAVTSWGPVEGGAFGPLTIVCTPAAPALPLPTFTYNATNYVPQPLEFSSVDAFHLWLAEGNRKIGLSGTYRIWETVNEPSQANRIDLGGVQMGDDLTIITNAPIYTDGITEQPGITSGKILGLISHYAPPPSTACDVNNDGSECAIHAKNGFNVNEDGSCKVSVLIYSDNGQSAIKNNSIMCGTVISEGILIKNNQTVNFDPEVLRVIGVGPTTFEIAKWEELPPE